MFWKKKKKERIPRGPKPSVKDYNPWSKVFFTIALAGLVWGANELLNLTRYDYSISDTSSTVISSSSTPNNTGVEGEDTINILSLDVEQIEGLANTIAGRNAIWYGYKGNPLDHRAVEKHFREQFAKFINSGIIPVDASWAGRSVAFAYAVSDQGVVTFVGKIPGGDLDDDYVYVVLKRSLDGSIQVIPAQDENGEPIIMLYYIKVRFAIT